jgi:hypothetical protein
MSHFPPNYALPTLPNEILSVPKRACPATPTADTRAGVRDADRLAGAVIDWWERPFAVMQ